MTVQNKDKEEEKIIPTANLMDVITGSRYAMVDEFADSYFGETQIITVDDYIAAAYQYLRKQQNEKIMLCIRPEDYTVELDDRINNLFNKRHIHDETMSSGHAIFLITKTKHSLDQALKQMDEYINK